VLPKAVKKQGVTYSILVLVWTPVYRFTPWGNKRVRCIARYNVTTHPFEVI